MSVPFLILSTARSGTNLLRALLNQHPRVRCLDEMLRAGPPIAGELDEALGGDTAAQAEIDAAFAAEPGRFLKERVFHDAAVERDACGFKLFYSHPPGPHRAGIWELLAGFPELRVIHLVRRNRLRRHVSLAQAVLTDVWSQEIRSDAPPPAVHVDPDALLADVAEVDRAAAWALSRLFAHPLLDMTYEDLARDPSREQERALAFLGATPLGLPPVRARGVSAPLRASITNHDSLRARLAGTVLADDFDPEPPRPATPPLRCWIRGKDAPLRLFGQIAEAELGLVPEFLRHYAALGVTRFHLILHGAVEGRRALRDALGSPAVEIEAERDGPLPQAELSRLVRRHLGEWVLVADPGELLELPCASLTATLRALALAGATSLPSASPDPSRLAARHPLFLVHEGTTLAPERDAAPDGLPRSPLPICGVLHGALPGGRRRPQWPDRGQRAEAAFLTRLRAGSSPARLRRHLASRLASWPAGHPLPPRLDAFSARRARIAFVTQELPSLTATGGIGTYVAAGAEVLAGAGHQVTIALVSAASAASADRAREHWRRRGIELAFVPERRDGEPIHYPGLGARLAAWLHERAFDVVHFPDCAGLGAESAIARRQGLMLTTSSIVVTTHGGIRWHSRSNRAPRTAHELRVAHAESRLLAMADHVVSPSRFMLAQRIRDGEEMPANRWVLPNVVGGAARQGQRTGLLGESARADFGGLAFFGRLEPLKGIDVLCDALDRLEGWRGDLPVAFLGAPSAPEWRAYLQARARKWTRAFTLHESLSSAEALQRMRDGRDLALMPSRADNSPYTVFECLTAGIPFLAGRVGGIPELIHADDHARVLVAPDPTSLAAAIERAVSLGAAPARPAWTAEDAELAYVAWHEALLAVSAARAFVPRAEKPRVAIVLLAGPAGRGVSTAEALTRQRGVDFDLSAGDDTLGATEADALWRRSPRQRHHSRGGCQAVRVVPVASIARWSDRVHAIVRQGDGDHLLFCPAGALPDPRMAALLLTACLAEAASAAVSDCTLVGHGAPTVHAQDGPLALAPHLNLFGGPCVLIRRAAFEALGGFRSEPALAGLEHWDLLNRLLMEGGRVARVPAALYRVGVANDLPAFVNPPAAALRAAWTPFLDRVPAGLRDAFGLLADGPWKTDVAHLVELQRMAASLREGPGVPLLTARDAGVAGALEAIQQATAAATSVGLEVLSLGTDPILVLPALAFPRGRQAIRVVVEMDCDQPSLAQLFWTSLDGPEYSEEQSVRAVTRVGPNRVLLITPEMVPVGRLRFDPAIDAGRMLIRSVVVESHAARGAGPDLWMRG